VFGHSHFAWDMDLQGEQRTLFVGNVSKCLKQRPNRQLCLPCVFSHSHFAWDMDLTLMVFDKCKTTVPYL
jgi:hypothetical protein